MKFQIIKNQIGLKWASCQSHLSVTVFGHPPINGNIPSLCAKVEWHYHTHQISSKHSLDHNSSATADEVQKQIVILCWFSWRYVLVWIVFIYLFLINNINDYIKILFQNCYKIIVTQYKNISNWPRTKVKIKQKCLMMMSPRCAIFMMVHNQGWHLLLSKNW